MALYSSSPRRTEGTDPSIACFYVLQLQYKHARQGGSGGS